VFGGLNRLLVTAAVAVAILVMPQAALASGCDGGPSAVQVYKECPPNGGGNSTSGGAGGPGSGATSQPISPQTARAFKKAGLSLKAFGVRRVLESSPATGATEPTAIGSAFDLGSGPTTLLMILTGTAVVLLAGIGARGWRRSHRA
jgi:hypothetical protein